MKYRKYKMIKQLCLLAPMMILSSGCEKSAQLALAPLDIAISSIDVSTAALIGKEDTTIHYICEYLPENEFRIVYLARIPGMLHAKNKDGETPLHVAVRKNRKSSLVTTLLDAGADVNTRNNRGFTPLQHLAYSGGSLELIELLLERGANIEDETDSKETLLHLAVKAPSDANIKFLLDSGIDINKQDSYGNSILHYAVSNHKLRAVKMLLDAGSRVNVKNLNKETPLDVAINSKSDFHIIENLLSFGAIFEDFDEEAYAKKIMDNESSSLVIRVLSDYNVLQNELLNKSLFSESVKRNDWLSLSRLSKVEFSSALTQQEKQELLFLAIRNNSRACLPLLIEMGVDISVENENGVTPLSSAIKEDRSFFVADLVKQGADFSHDSCNRYCLMSIAVFLYDNSLLDMFIKGCPDRINQQSHRGDTALHIASKGCEESTARILIENGANSNIQNNKGHSPLHEAVLKNNLSMVVLLIEGKADPKIIDNKGLNAVQLAAKLNDKEIFHYLSQIKS